MKQFYEANPDLKPNPRENYRLTDFMWRKFQRNNDFKPSNAETENFRQQYEKDRLEVIDMYWQPRQELDDKQNANLKEAVREVYRKQRALPMSENEISNLQTFLYNNAPKEAFTMGIDEEYLGSEDFMNKYDEWTNEI